MVDLLCLKYRMSYVILLSHSHVATIKDPNDWARRDSCFLGWITADCRGRH